MSKFSVDARYSINAPSLNSITVGQAYTCVPTLVTLSNNPSSGGVTVGPDHVSLSVPQNGDITLNITICDGSSGSQTMVYFPVGLAVQGVVTSGKIPGRGGPAFPKTTVSNDGLSISLEDKNDANEVGSYEFVILFQDSNGNFGILDPKIVNMD
jgi:hypothetical protein